MRILYLPNSKCQQRQFEKPNFVAYPIRLAMEAQWYREQGHEINWGNAIGKYDKIISKPENLPFLSLPHPDRILTKALDPIYQKNGNFKYHPGTYIQSASGCWWGKCSFCVENHNEDKLVKVEVRPVGDILTEIDECYKMGFKEIFDDSATFPVNQFLDDFCEGMIDRKYKIRLGCNMRLGVAVNFCQMKAAGFRMLLFGLESANQKTLDKIGKGVKVEYYKYIIKAAKAGLEPHVAVMFGYPWEDDSDAVATLRLVWWLLKKGYAKTAQASLLSPNGKIKQRKYVNKLYGVWYSPIFWLNKLKDIHDKDDLKYLWRQIKAGLE